jgi:hypothetical protein
MHKPFFLLFFLLIVTIASAQQLVIVKGTVVSAADNKGIDYVAVQIDKSGLGVLTQEGGTFQIAVPERMLGNRLAFSCLGYKTVYIDSSTYLHNDTLLIKLNISETTLNEFEFTSLSAKEILKRSAESLNKWMYSDSLLQDCFYRQYHKENGEYVRLIDAHVSIVENIIPNAPAGQLKERVRINEMRRSFVYERNGDIHGDHLTDLLLGNPLSYYKTSFLNVNNLAFYKPKTISDSGYQYIIFLRYRESSSDVLENITLWINKTDYAITRMENRKYPNPMFSGRNEYRGDWLFQNEVEVLETKQLNGRYFLSSFIRHYNHQIVNKISRNVQYVVEETFELTALQNHTTSIGVEIKKGGFNSFSSLYTMHYKYNPQFWQELNVEKRFPLEDYVKKDVEHEKLLEEQFVESGL